jgi:hypothetical protein
MLMIMFFIFFFVLIQFSATPLVESIDVTATSDVQYDCGLLVPLRP